MGFHPEIIMELDAYLNSKRCAIVAVYNGSATLKKCLTHLDSCSDIDQIILVENDSTDNSLEVIEEIKSDKITLLPQEKNTGFAEANNIGLSYAINHGFQEALLINQDVYIDDSALNILLELLQSSETIGMVSPIQLNANGSGMEHYFEEILDRQKVFKRKGDRRQASKQVLFVNAACWLMKLEVVKEMGGFDPIFHTYGEDQNFCDRLMLTQYELRLSFKSSVIHDKPPRSYEASQKTLNHVHSSYRISQLIKPTVRKSISIIIAKESRLGFLAKLKGDVKSHQKHMFTIRRIKTLWDEIARRRKTAFYQRKGLFLNLNE
jgi:GT2 family glycosyltransferase